MNATANKPFTITNPRIHPREKRSLFGGEVKVYGFGIVKDQPRINWTLKGMEGSREPLKTHANVFKALRGIPWLTRVYAPSPVQFNSVIAKPEDFLKDEIRKKIIRFDEQKILYRGIDADGISDIRPGNGYVMSSADCALVVVRWKKKTWVAHAGRNSLMDRRSIDSGGKETSKQHASVVDAILSEIPPANHAEVDVYIGFSVSAGPHFAHPIDHPIYGESNRKMLGWIATHCMSPSDLVQAGEKFFKLGHINISAIIRQQFINHGVRNEKIIHDGLCTHTNKDEDGMYHWHSQTRQDGMRNLIVVVCIS